MTILKIVQTDMGEIAYLFDGEQVFKVWVKDYTQPKRVRVTESVEQYEEEVVMPRKKVAPPVKTPEIQMDDVEERMVEGESIVFNKPGVVKKTIIPPGLASIMKRQGTPGENTITM